MRQNKLTAFTLIELLVVIAIIGILSALIVVGMNSTTQKATIAKAQVFSNSLRNSLMSDLVSEWKMDCSKNDGDAADLTCGTDSWGDYSASSMGGSLIVRTGSKCINKTCLDLHTASDWFSYNNRSTLYNYISTNKAYAVEGWGYFTNLTGVNVGAILRAYTNGDNSWFIFMYRNTGTAAGRLNAFIVYTDTSNISQTSSIVPICETNKWYHFVMTVSLVGNNLTHKLYINGSVFGTYTNTTTSKLGGKDTDGTPTLYSGAWLDNGVNFLIDGLRFYKNVVPISQIQQNYFAGLNKLLSKRGIDQKEYNARVSELVNSFAAN